MRSNKRIIVIGGSAAGPKAAARARRLDQNADIVIIQKEPDLSMASCGYPYYIGGIVDNRSRLLSTGGGTIRDSIYYRDTKGIAALVETEVTFIDRKKKVVVYRNLVTDKTDILGYDKLIIATGADSVVPDIPGKELAGIVSLKSMRDADFLKSVKDEGRITEAVVIGGGPIGLETCEALQSINLQVTLVEIAPQLLTFLDRQLAQILENYVKTKVSDVITSKNIVRFEGKNGTLDAVVLSDGTKLPCGLAVLAAGVKPNSGLARSAGIATGRKNGIVVNQYMQTSDPDIYAVGDCTEQHHLITDGSTYAPFGDLANLEGRTAGENSVMGNKAVFHGTINSSICKVFDYTVGSTGLSETKAYESGYTNLMSAIVSGTDKPGFMKGQTLVSKIIVDSRSQKIIGFQCVGPGNVNKQVAQAAVAIQAQMIIKDIVCLDLPYAPPFNSAIDHFIVCAHVIENKLKGFLKSVSAEEVMGRIADQDNNCFLDVRDPQEFETVKLNIGETLIPLGMLRKRLNELPHDKNSEIIVYCKTGPRSYEAALFLESQGWTNVKIMEGGIAAWPGRISEPSRC